MQGARISKFHHPERVSGAKIAAVAPDYCTPMIADVHLDTQNVNLNNGNIHDLLNLNYKYKYQTNLQINY